MNQRIERRDGEKIALQTEISHIYRCRGIVEKFEFLKNQIGCMFCPRFVRFDAKRRMMGNRRGEIGQ